MVRNSCESLVTLLVARVLLEALVAASSSGCGSGVDASSGVGVDAFPNQRFMYGKGGSGVNELTDLASVLKSQTFINSNSITCWCALQRIHAPLAPATVD